MEARDQKKNIRQNSIASKFGITKQIILIFIGTIIFSISLTGMVAFADISIPGANGYNAPAASTAPAQGNGTQGTDAHVPINDPAQQTRRTTKQLQKTYKPTIKHINREANLAGGKTSTKSGKKLNYSAYSIYQQASSKQQKQIASFVKSHHYSMGDFKTTNANKGWNTLLDWGKRNSKNKFNGSNKAWKTLIDAEDKYIGSHNGKKASQLQKRLYKLHRSLNIAEASYNRAVNKVNNPTDGNGNKKETAEAVEESLANGTYHQPTTLSGKIGEAIFNFFWSSAIGKWFAKNSLGATIFGGATSPSELSQLVSKTPYALMYPANSEVSNMNVIANWLEPAMLGLAVVVLVFAVLYASGKFGARTIINNPANARTEFLHNVADVFMTSLLLAAYPSMVNTLLQLDGELLLFIQNMLAGMKVNGQSVLTVAIRLGFDKGMINAMSSGALLGINFAGAIFALIYLFTYLGLAVWVKYYYFIRSAAFTILIGLGPLFISFWATDWGKNRFWNWFKEMVSTIYIQCIHGLTLMFMATFMAYNNNRITLQAASTIAKQDNWAAGHPIASAIDTVGNSIPFLGGLADKITGRPSTVGASNFEVMITGFVIMIAFQPLARSLADLFGLQTNLLDNIHQSTSRSLQTMAMVGGSALALAALNPAALALGKAAGSKALNGLGIGIKAAQRATKGNRLKAFAEARAKHRKRNPLSMRKAFGGNLSHLNGIMGPGAGRLAAMSAASSAGLSPEMALAMTKDGGKIGEHAARLTNRPLAHLGLQKQKPYTDTAAGQAEKNMIKQNQEKAIEADIGKRLDAASGDPEGAYENYLKEHPQDLAGAEQLRKDLSAWHNASADTKKQMVAQRAHDMLYGNKGAWAKVGDLRNNLNGQLQEMDGDAYDQKHLGDGEINDSYVRQKAQAMGLTGALNKFKQENPEAGSIAANSYLNATGKKVISSAQAAAEMNGAQTNNVVTPFDSTGINQQVASDAQEYGESIKGDPTLTQEQYDSKIEQFKQADRQKLMEQGSPHVIGNENMWGNPAVAGDGNSAFKASNVNLDGFKKDFGKSLAGLGIDDSTRKALLNSADKTPGQDMLQSVPATDGSGTATTFINQDLYHNLAQSRAANASNLTGDVNSFTPQDFENINSPKYNPAQQMGIDPTQPVNAKMIGNYFKRKNAEFAPMAKNAALEGRVADLDNSMATTFANYDPFNAHSWLDFDDGIISGFNHGAGLSDGTMSTGPTGTANERVAAANAINPQSFGITPQAARELIPRRTNSIGLPTRLDPGQMRIVTTNGFSYIEAQDGQGVEYMVGNLGLGDSSLGADQTVYTDLDFNSTGDIIRRTDPITHQLAQPYQMINGNRVPYAMQAGGPDLSTMLPTQTQSFAAKQPVVYSPFHRLTEAPILAESNKNYSPAPTLEQASQNYDDFYADFDNSYSVITGQNKNFQNGQQALTNVNSTLFDDIVPKNARVQVPLKQTDNGFIYDNNRPLNFTYDDYIDPHQQSIFEDGIRMRLNSPKRLAQFEEAVNTMMPTTQRSLVNERMNNQPNLDITLLDTMHDPTDLSNV